MAMIIKLTTVTDTAQDEPVLDDVREPQEAEVILFPGVRYERWGDQTAEPNQAPKGGRGRSNAKRDWMDI